MKAKKTCLSNDKCGKIAVFSKVSTWYLSSCTLFKQPLFLDQLWWRKIVQNNLQQKQHKRLMIHFCKTSIISKYWNILLLKIIDFQHFRFNFLSTIYFFFVGDSLFLKESRQKIHLHAKFQLIVLSHSSYLSVKNNLYS